MKKQKKLNRQRPVTPSSTVEHPVVSNVKWMEHVETAGGILLLLMVVVFHALMMIYSGALWRDEVNTFNMASMSSLGEIIKNMEYDSFPILWFLIVRGWIYAGLGSEIGLRVLGLLVGIGGALSLIWACRTLGSRVPLVALVLLGFCCPTAYPAGDSLRAYGCGMMLMFLALVFFWKAIQDPCPRKILPAGLLAILSVQCIYFNAAILFAMGMGGVAVGLRKRDVKKIATALGIGVAAALTLIPYVDIIKQVDSWNMVVRINFTIPWMMGKFRQAVEPAGAYVYWIWLALPPMAMAACIWRWFQTPKKNSSQERDRLAFIFTTLIVAVIGYIVFLKALSYRTEPWYYLSILAMMAAMIDTAVSLLVKTCLAGRIVRLVFVLIVVATTSVNNWNTVHTRWTNIDLVAAKLESLATKNDLIVVNRFFFGIPFARYYKGDTPWVTLPPLTEHLLHRYDMFKEKMMETKPLAPVHDKIQKTLQAGNRVWVVGWIYFLRDGELPGELPPAPHSRYGWSEGAYYTGWWRQTAYLIQHHVNKAELVSINNPGRISRFEKMSLLVVQGWHP